MRQHEDKPPLWMRMAGVAAVMGMVVLLPSKVAVWVDAQGRTVLSDSEPPPESGVVQLSPAELAARWRGRWQDEPVRADTPDPVTSRLASSLQDLRHGDRRRGLAELRQLHADHPERADVAWRLAQVELARGRPEAALPALDHALALAVEMPAGWRDEALELRRRIENEIVHSEALSDPASVLQSQDSTNFRLSYDHAFAGRGDGDRVLQALEETRERLSTRLGLTLGRPLEVRLYTRATYLREYSHRFGFATVGFYDGAIHVVSAQRPERGLTALLTHEYTHALFLETLHSHEPFFLNEGLAQREEEHVRGISRISTTDWRTMLDASRDGTWLPLRSLVRGFSGLKGDSARLAYLESRAAVELIDARREGTTQRWLARCAKGEAWEAALRAETGLSLDELDTALRADVRARFPTLPALGE